MILTPVPPTSMQRVFRGFSEVFTAIRKQYTSQKQNVAKSEYIQLPDRRDYRRRTKCQGRASDAGSARILLLPDGIARYRGRAPDDLDRRHAAGLPRPCRSRSDAGCAAMLELSTLHPTLRRVARRWKKCARR